MTVPQPQRRVRRSTPDDAMTETVRKVGVETGRGELSVEQHEDGSMHVLYHGEVSREVGRAILAEYQASRAQPLPEDRAVTELLADGETASGRHRHGARSVQDRRPQ